MTIQTTCHKCRHFRITEYSLKHDCIGRCYRYPPRSKGDMHDIRPQVAVDCLACGEYVPQPAASPETAATPVPPPASHEGAFESLANLIGSLDLNAARYTSLNDALYGRQDEMYAAVHAALAECEEKGWGREHPKNRYIRGVEATLDRVFDVLFHGMVQGGDE